MDDYAKTPLQLPLIDISQPLNSSSLTTLSQACRDWGFFHIKNHGISKDLYTKICMFSKNILSLPLDTKLKLGPSSSLKTYTPHFIASPFFESLRVSGPDYYSSAKRSGDILFEAPNPEFYKTMQEYGKKMMELSKQIMIILLKCLGDGFDTKYYESEFGQCHGYLRINSYSPPGNIEYEAVEGLGMHTDMSCITILHQDEVGGLQVKAKDGKWIDIKYSEGELVVNIGDLLQAWSNGKFRSSQHRVVLRKPSNRLSLAFFWCFEDEKMIVAPDVVEKERIYRPFLCGDYIRFKVISEKGRFDKVKYTIDDFAVVDTA
ncbi:hypothetical protein IEQ34_022832 [Dendrobium chrysotoxum]|uniref:Fe2OG dioxygenase domain-containing protein n=1 Tax=Dendrobium chrysotoxum TaxID=161865 RepID=A0AAV7G037_DENCH|nr:hypothetical protein IEQ34_022832 [Dendrobium chrysotoxum]